jgi:hypothetical protein
MRSRVFESIGRSRRAKPAYKGRRNYRLKLAMRITNKKRLMDPM